MSYQAEAVIKDLHSGKFAPIYFLQGEEPFFIDQISDYIEKHALQEHEKGFNQIIMYGKDVDMPAVLNNARRFPMMADRQVVIVKEAQNLQDLGRESGELMLSNYIKNPLPSTILVFAHKYKKLDGKKKLSKELDKHTILINSQKIKDYQLAQWIEGYIASQGHQIDQNGARFLAESIGNNLEVIANELGKMFINFTEPTKITIDHIQGYIGISKEYNNFELAKAIGMKDVNKANKIIDYFAQNPRKYPLLPTLVNIFNFFYKLILFHGNRQVSDAELARIAGVHPYFVKEYKMAVSKYPMAKILDCMTYLREADLRSKGVDTTGMEEKEILRELIFKIMH